MTTDKKPSWWTLMDEKDSESNYEKLPSLKLEDGQSVELEFLSEGREYKDKETSREYVIFEVDCLGERKAWFANKAFWSLFKSIRDLGFPLIGKKAILKRTGVGKETLWHLNKIE